MEKEKRIELLEEIKGNENNVIKSGISIMYDGERIIFKTYKIPLEYLIYNKYNGRIGAAVKSYEKQHQELNPEKTEDVRIIENYLWVSKKDRNKVTEESLANEFQKNYGVVTKDGVIVDGNRRAMLLNKIYREREEWQSRHINVDHCKYFEAIILDDEADQKRVMKLETELQMGDDEKVGYDAIQKYLKCSQLQDVGYTISDIAVMMSESESSINEYLKTLHMMENYLEYLGYDGIYTRLEKKEGQFVDLTKFVEQIKKGSKVTNWFYQDEDINDFQSIAFDYIRSDYEGKEFRRIFDFFKNKDLWEKFRDAHIDKLKQLNINEESVEALFKENPGEDFSILLEQRDEKYKNETIKDFQNTLRYINALRENVIDKDEPSKLLNKALDALKNINVNNNGFRKQESLDLVIEISRTAFELKKVLEKYL